MESGGAIRWLRMRQVSGSRNPVRQTSPSTCRLLTLAGLGVSLSGFRAASRTILGSHHPRVEASLGFYYSGFIQTNKQTNTELQSHGSGRILMHAKFKDVYSVDMENKEEPFSCNLDDFCVVLPIPQELSSLDPAKEDKEGGREGDKEDRKEGGKEGWGEGMEEREVKEQDKPDVGGDKGGGDAGEKRGQQGRGTEQEREEAKCPPLDDLEITLESETVEISNTLRSSESQPAGETRDPLNVLVTRPAEHLFWQQLLHEPPRNLQEHAHVAQSTQSLEGQIQSMQKKMKSIWQSQEDQMKSMRQSQDEMRQSQDEMLMLLRQSQDAAVAGRNAHVAQR